MEREFPKAAKSPFLVLAGGMTLNAVLSRWGGGLTPQRINELKSAIERI